MSRELPLAELTLRQANFTSYSATDHHPTVDKDANIICSDVADRPGYHKIVLDIDLPVKALGSSTPGHSHLYIDKEVPWEDYLRLLWVMADIGLVEEGFAHLTQERGYSALRLPWVHKEQPVCTQCTDDVTCSDCRQF